MDHAEVLIIDDNSASIRHMADALEAAGVRYAIASTMADGWEAFCESPGPATVLLRGISENIDGVTLCRRIRLLKSRDEVNVLALLRDREFGRGAEMFLAGSNDLLVEPFDSAELYLRAGINVPDRMRRIDTRHVDQEDTAQLILPEFDPVTRRLSCGPAQGLQSGWESDPSVKQVPLDRIILCPECEGVATFRPGCGACGSAWTREEVLIHHYACAHVGPEQEYLRDGRFDCPKCRLKDLVAGADFEQTSGCFRCSDCAALFTEPRMIGHCLACDHRFAASDGILRDVYGYQVKGQPSPASINRPAYLGAESRHRTSC